MIGACTHAKVWLLVLLACGFGGGSLLGQEATGTVTGFIVQVESEAPVSDADVRLKRRADSTAVARAFSSSDGQFHLGGVDKGTYFLKISTLGYATRTTEPFELEAGIVYDFGRVQLSVDALLLDPIEVVSAREVVSREPDRTSYLLSGIPATQGGDIASALRALPELDVDFDGHVELRGERPAIWLDGRPAPMTGPALRRFLDQFPADLVDRIEVIENPGSEFHAEGTGGIMNIVLTEGADLGLSGNVFVNADTGGNTGVGGRTTLQRGDWIWDGSLAFRRRDSETETFNLRQDLRSEPSDLVRRDTWNAGESLGADANLRTSYTPREEARLWVAANYSGQGREGSGSVATTHMDNRRDPFLHYDHTNRSQTEGQSLNLRTGLEWRWDPIRHIADLELRYMRGVDHAERSEEVEADRNLDSSEELPSELTLKNEESDERELRLHLRYRRPIGEHTSLDMGYSRQDRSTVNERIVTLFDPVNHPEREVSLRGFSRSRTLNSAYVTLEHTVTERFVIQGGIRAEHVAWQLDFPTADPARGRHFDFFPSANVSWNSGRGARLRLSYSQRTSRPSASVLDPTDRSIDPLERIVGNPEIDPQYTHHVKLDGSWSGDFGTLSTSPYVSKTVHGWERITKVDDQGVRTRTWGNVSSETSTGLSLNYSLPGLAGWRGSANLTGSRTYRDADPLAPRFSGSHTRWQALLNLNGPIYGGLTGQASLRYRGATQDLQGRTSSQAAANFWFRYRFLDDRLSVDLSLRDPFGLQGNEREIRDSSVWEVYRSSESTRRARLSVSYALGGGGSGGARNARSADR